MHEKEGDLIAISKASLAAKKRILSACVRLFLEKGYRGKANVVINNIDENGKLEYEGISFVEDKFPAF